MKVPGIWILIFVSVELCYGQTTVQPTIGQGALKELMNEKIASSGVEAYDAFTNRRNLLDRGSGSEELSLGLKSMREFIRFKMSQILGRAGGKEEKHYLNETSFETNILDKDHVSYRKTGVNYITVLSQKKNATEEDRPIVILANYDTDQRGTNPVEDNGSGIAALLVIGNQIARDLENKKYTLKHSVVLAAVDASFRKYNSHSAGSANADDLTGADHFAKHFLPIYLRGRSKFAGVIVLDSFMNYDNASNSQGTSGMDRAYPKAYAELSARKFAGDFLGLVARGGDSDADLIGAFEEGWDQAKKQKREQGGNNQGHADPALIKFVHTVGNDGSEAFTHFLKSDQSAFWNHHARTGPMYPAILLTDTRSFRNSSCAQPRRSCSPTEYYNEATEYKNQEFAYRTTLAVYETVVKLQSGGFQVQVSSFVVLVSVAGALTRFFGFQL